MNRFVAVPSAVLAGLMLLACSPQAPQSAAPAVSDVAATPKQAEGCSAKVQSFGPTQIVRGESFYAQADGTSAYWVIMAPGSQGFALAFDGQPVAYSKGENDTISFLHQEPLIAAAQQRDAMEFDVLCEGRVVDKISIPVVAEAPPVVAEAPPAG